MLPDDLSPINRSAAEEILSDPEAHALAAVIAANALLDGDLLDEDDEIIEEEILRMLLAALGADAHEDNIIRIIGFLNALSSEVFVRRPRDFSLLSSAIVEGDLFYYEENPDEMMLADGLWALYQVDLLFEDNLVEELGPNVLKLLQRLSDGEGFDPAEFSEFSEGEAPPDSIATHLVDLRRKELAGQLNRLQVPVAWIDSDDELARLMTEG